MTPRLEIGKKNTFGSAPSPVFFQSITASILKCIPVPHAKNEHIEYMYKINGFAVT